MDLLHLRLLILGICLLGIIAGIILVIWDDKLYFRGMSSEQEYQLKSLASSLGPASFGNTWRTPFGVGMAVLSFFGIICALN